MKIHKDSVKKSRFLNLCCALVLVSLSSTVSHASYTDDNPFIEAMLRMMEVFGFIDRRQIPLGVPYLPADRPLSPTFGGVPGFGAYPGMSSWPGAGGFPMNPSMGAMPPGLGQFPMQPPMAQGMGGFGAPPGMPGWGGMPGPWNEGGQAAPAAGLLDGIWELNKGGLLIIKADAARLYVSRERYQDYVIRYDDSRLWWRPHNGNRTSQYRYEVRDDRMVLADSKGNLILLRRRR